MQVLKSYLLKTAVDLKMSLQMAIILTPFSFIFEITQKWFFENYVYVSWVLTAILIDWIFGSWKHLKNRTFSFKLNGIGLFIKISLSLGAGMLFEGFNHLTADSEFIVTTLKMVFRTSVFIYPTLSALKSMNIISNGKMPPDSIMNMFKKFNENLDFNSFNPKQDEKNN